MNTPRRSRVMCVFRKELVDALRDRKSMINVLVYALIGPLVLLPMLVFFDKQFSRDEATIHLPTVGAARAPALVDALREHRVLAEDTSGDVEAAVRSERMEVALVIDEAYGSDFGAGKPATVRIVFDGARTAASPVVRRVTHAIEAYGRRVGMQRLLVRGVSPSITNAISLEEHDVSTPQAQAALLLGSVPIFVLMAMIMGSGFAAVDVTAGERERGSLEALFTNPVTAAEIVLGKILAVTTLGAGASTACIVGFAAVLDGATRFGLSSISVALSLHGGLMMLLGVLPLTLVIAALEMLLAGSAKTVREANTVVMMLTLAPAIPGMAMLFGKIPEPLRYLPIVHEELLITETLQGKAIPLWRVLGGGVVALLVAVAVVLVTVRAQARLRSQAI